MIDTGVNYEDALLDAIGWEAGRLGRPYITKEQLTRTLSHELGIKLEKRQSTELLQYC